jgi:Gluconate 2-dehydrogenase subunit 3
MNRREALKLIGYAVPLTAATDLFLSCQSEAKVSLEWKPVFLTDKQANILAEVAETILPKTQTPGAKELGVPQFIDKMLKELLTAEDQKEFAEGLEKLDKDCKSVQGKAFSACTPQEREAYITKVDKEAASAPTTPSVWGITLGNPSPPPFFRKLKGMVLFGYFTSEKVGKEVLTYDPVPGDFIGCMPLKEVGNAWTE